MVKKLTKILLVVVSKYKIYFKNVSAKGVKSYEKVDTITEIIEIKGERKTMICFKSGVPFRK